MKQDLNFIAIDFETATARRASVCETGICVVRNGEIAERLGISELTVKAHKQNALRYFKERSNDLILLVMFLTDEAVN